METNLIQQLLSDFESLAQTTENGVEFWLARDLQQLLGYTEWRNFIKVIDKAKDSVDTSQVDTSDHFVEINKKVSLGSNAQREIEDIMLTRYACYLIAQNGDPSKPEIAFAQSYFALQTRKIELIEQKIEDIERLSARKKLSETEKELSKVIFEQTKSDKNFALIRSKGDAALFGMPTKDMKEKRNIKETKPLADHMPTIILKAKDFATEITIYNAKNNNMTTEKSISNEHVINNKSVRDTLISRGIVPENFLLSL
ncbi:MAG: DNA damage-inducible protein D [Candidatus Absconditabacteria bacterium]|nr:DNA damage-inducible protein D [Candidatus Absconditabacteria bacterium]MDD3868801.1 DNA damage-inducible protein D [Candidatus Absconditabacteria bacterium]MDD4713872.1 DNA damage-inducible protein D [Candidatus Absconditabacteria bacterium]